MHHTQAFASALESQVDIARTETKSDFDTLIGAYRYTLGKTGTASLNADTLVETLERLKEQVLRHIDALPDEIDAAFLRSES